MKKTILFVVDGMRPDSLADIETAQRILKKSTYTMNARTVFPSVTLPCHMSLFHSVTPERHGTTTNVYMPQVRPIRGLCEVLKHAGKKCAIFYNWEDLRDISRPNSLAHSVFYAGKAIGYLEAGEIITNELIEYVKKYETDFTFLYLGHTDWAGHKFGWMSEEYLSAMQSSWSNIEKVMNELGNEYNYIITADHGGHDRTHGSEMPEDMIIPIALCGENFEADKEIENVSILDIAPTVTALLGVEPDEEWEGRSLV